MEIKRVSGTSLMPVESTPHETEPQPKISRGIGDIADSFESEPKASKVEDTASALQKAAAISTALPPVGSIYAAIFSTIASVISQVGKQKENTSPEKLKNVLPELTRSGMRD